MIILQNIDSWTLGFCEFNYPCFSVFTALEVPQGFSILFSLKSLNSCEIVTKNIMYKEYGVVFTSTSKRQY